MKGRTSDQFRVDENGMTSDGYHCLVPASRKSMYIGNSIAFAIAAVLLIAAYCYVGASVMAYQALIRVSIVVLLLLVAVYCFASPAVYYRRYRYRIDDDKVDIRKGVVTISHTMVPIERIHQVDVKRGPINRAYGLANVQITTAGGLVTIEYLEEDIAEDIAERLNRRVVGILKQRV